ncbi:hypothetical protein [Mucilaginibacter glaciei]|uniref:Uncharacterized protein n=1 Tax=Mucilaginibacter glaciei TaxID=2772109 RepID=A0A926NRN1_9SPHI|nr:hypothetical protein [Mucilaginibacter glaciei]MBD1393470.1 hypothetical protein [Mucilaginibacter glaciei]
MKKILLLLTLLMSVAFYSCKKETVSQATPVLNSAILTPNMSLVNTPSYYYVDLTIDPRPAGQSYDTYHVTLNGISFKVSNLYWDSATYPNLVNGTPVYGTMSLDPATTVYDVYPVAGNGLGGSQFAILSGGLCGVPTAKIAADIKRFFDDLSSLANTYTTIPIPILNNYLSGDYGRAGCSRTTTNVRLIRCTTGSNFALASADYPYAPRSSNNLGNPNALALIQDPWDATIKYELYGANSIVTGVSCSQNNQFAELGASATGIFTPIPNNSTNFHCVGKIFRRDGTYFDYDVTQDIY